MNARRELGIVRTSAAFLSVVAITATAAQVELGVGPEFYSDPTSTYKPTGVSLTYTPEGEHAMTVTFGARGVMDGGAFRATVLVDDGVTDSPFHGDYMAAGINKLQVDMASNNGYAPSLARWQLKGARRSWYRDISVAGLAGEVQTIQVGLTLESGWYSYSSGADKAGMFAEDLQNVTYVAIQLSPGGDQPDAIQTPQQSYTISNVVGINDSGISSTPGTLSPLQRGLIARFGYGYDSVDKLTEEMLAQDSTGDGIPDWVEILAMWVFDAEIVSVDEGGVTIEWFAVRNQKYTVSRTDDLNGTLTPVAGLIEIVADSTGNMTALDTTAEGEGPFYYRVRRHVPPTE